MLILFFLTEFGQIHYLLSAAIAIECAILSNFIFNEKWTFKTRRSGTFFSRLIKSNGVFLVGAAINLLTVYLLTSVLGVWYLAANLFGIALAACWNFLAVKKWVWQTTNN